MTEPEVGPSPEETRRPRRWWRSSRWAGIAALAMAMIATAVAITAWLRPAEGASPTFTDQQTTQAKSAVCSAYTAVHNGAVKNTHLTDPSAHDAVGQLAIAANARLALLGGGAYLHDRVTSQPATPADLAQAVNSIGNTLEQLGVGYLEAAPSIVLDPLRHELDSQVEQVNSLCG